MSTHRFDESDRTTYLQGLKELANEQQALLIFDEIQTFGWIDTLLAANHFGVIPDLLTLAKGVGLGFPLAAVLMRENLRNVLKYNEAESTPGGHVVSCAAAVRGLELLSRRDFKIESKGRLLEGELRRLSLRHSSVAEIRRFGLIVAITFRGAKRHQARMVKQLCTLAKKHGLIIRPSQYVVILKPPIVVSEEEILKATSILANALLEAECI